MCVRAWVRACVCVCVCVRVRVRVCVEGGGCNDSHFTPINTGTCAKKAVESIQAQCNVHTPKRQVERGGVPDSPGGFVIGTFDHIPFDLSVTACVDILQPLQSR